MITDHQCAEEARLLDRQRVGPAVDVLQGMGRCHHVTFIMSLITLWTKPTEVLGLCTASALSLLLVLDAPHSVSDPPDLIHLAGHRGKLDVHQCLAASYLVLHGFGWAIGLCMLLYPRGHPRRAPSRRHRTHPSSLLPCRRRCELTGKARSARAAAGILLPPGQKLAVRDVRSGLRRGACTGHGGGARWRGTPCWRRRLLGTASVGRLRGGVVGVPVLVTAAF